MFYDQKMQERTSLLRMLGFESRTCWIGPEEAIEYVRTCKNGCTLIIKGLDLDTVFVYTNYGLKDVVEVPKLLNGLLNFIKRQDGEEIEVLPQYEIY